MDNQLEIEMVPISGGEFQMVFNPSEAWKGEHQVQHTRVSSFEIGKFPVTQGQWRAVMGTNPSHFKNGDKHPVEKVSWLDCQEFIQKLNQLTGKHYRLPTEAEWEYAARGGSSDDRYGELEDIAWYGKNSGKSTHPVGLKQPNAYGLYDMLGNVFEWCSDWFGDYISGNVTDPTGPESGRYKVFRGGCWGSIDWYCRAPYRDRIVIGCRENFLGVRLAQSLPVEINSQADVKLKQFQGD